MSAQTQSTIAIQNRAVAYARLTAKELIAISACQTHTDGSTKLDVNYVNAIILDRLVSRVICTPVSVCVAKDSPDVNATGVQSAILVIQAVNDVAVIEMAH